MSITTLRPAPAPLRGVHEHGVDAQASAAAAGTIRCVRTPHLVGLYDSTPDWTRSASGSWGSVRTPDGSRLLPRAA